MDIHLSKESEVPLRQQLTEQIVFSIATGKLRTGKQLPSVQFNITWSRRIVLNTLPARCR